MLLAVQADLRRFAHEATTEPIDDTAWAKGRHGRYAYYHCRPKCRAVNIAKARLEGLFVDELERCNRRLAICGC
jgi:hypothetical protein